MLQAYRCCTGTSEAPLTGILCCRYPHDGYGVHTSRQWNECGAAPTWLLARNI
jgi:hypothetical protein